MKSKTPKIKANLNSNLLLPKNKKGLDSEVSTNNGLADPFTTKNKQLTPLGDKTPYMPIYGINSELELLEI